MEEGVLLRANQLPSQEGGKPADKLDLEVNKKNESKTKVTKDLVDVEVPIEDNVNGADEGKWSPTNILLSIFKLLYIPLGIITLLLCAANFYLNFPFALAITLASLVGIQPPGCQNMHENIKLNERKSCKSCSFSSY